MSRIQRGRFRRGREYVVVNPFRASSKEMLAVGTVVPSEEFPFGVAHLRSLFRRRRIGHLDSDWSDAQIARHQEILKKESDARIAAKKAISDEAAEDKAAEEKAAEEKVAEEKAAEEKAAEEKAAEEKAAEEKAAEEKAAEEKAAEEKAAEEPKKSKKSKK